MRIVLAGILAVSASAALAEATPSAICSLQVNGALVFNGPCQIDGAAPGGPFLAKTADGKYAVWIKQKSKGVSELLWNDTASSEQVETSLGTVVRLGACWANDKSKLCVTK